MKFADRLLLATVPPTAALSIRLLYLSLRVDTLGLEHLRNIWARGENAIIVFWHDQLLMMVFGYPGKGAKLLISSSKDGELLSRTMRYFGHSTVRGSSSRGGRAALRQLLALAKDPVDLVLTPDGPKGPRHEIKEGALHLAKVTGRPVVPMAFACSRGRRFNSWDRTLLPYPFARGVFSFATPVYYDQDESHAKFRSSLIQALQENQSCVGTHLESYGVSAV